jgi:hypothetical protein
MSKFSKISVVVLATIIAFAGVGNVNAKHRHQKKSHLCVSATASPKPSHSPKKPWGKKAAKKAKKIAKKCAVATPTASPSA